MAGEQAAREPAAHHVGRGRNLVRLQPGDFPHQPGRRFFLATDPVLGADDRLDAGVRQHSLVALHARAKRRKLRGNHVGGDLLARGHHDGRLCRVLHLAVNAVSVRLGAAANPRGCAAHPCGAECASQSLAAVYPDGNLVRQDQLPALPLALGAAVVCAYQRQRRTSPRAPPHGDRLVNRPGMADVSPDRETAAFRIARQVQGDRAGRCTGHIGFCGIRRRSPEGVPGTLQGSRELSGVF